MISNKTDGSIFETEFASFLQEKGFWVHKMTQSVDGQPADIIAQRKGCVWLIDCKVCRNDRFLLDRCEYNQHRAMTKWMEVGGTTPWFALKMSDGEVRMLSYVNILNIERKEEAKSIARYGLMDYYTSSLDNWVSAVTLWEAKHAR